MAFWIIIILGVVQGATEFLPISSSGHLVLLYSIFNINENTILLSVILHIATLLAVVFVYYKDIKILIKNPLCHTNKMLIAATIPTVIIVLIFKSAVESAFDGRWLVVGFVVTAIVLLVSEKISAKYENDRSFIFKSKMGMFDNLSITDMKVSFKQAITIGIVQGLASFPGVSRSGSTIATGLIVGVNKKEVANFSFLLSIPIILASGVYEISKLFNGNNAVDINVLGLGLGFLSSFFVGLFCIKVMINFVKKQKLIWFSIYLLALSTFMILNNYIFHLF